MRHTNNRLTADTRLYCTPRPLRTPESRGAEGRPALGTQYLPIATPVKTVTIGAEHPE